MSATPHDGAGTVFTFAGTTYTVTNIVVTHSDPAGGDNTIDVSHLGLTTGASIKTIQRPLKGSTTDASREVVIDYLGISVIEGGSTGTVSLTSAGSTLISGKAATVTSSTLTMATNDAVRGQATFTIAR